MNKKKALVTGITGQCGSYLAEHLLQKDYEVHGLNRRKSIDNFENIKGIINDIELIEGDVTDSISIDNIVNKGKYDNIFNCAAQSHVHVSFEQPILTFQVDTLGVLYLLDAVRKHSNHTKLLQMSTSELFGFSPPPQHEETPFMPQSPYACAKLAAHHLVRIYHEGYGLWCSCGICFNFESPRRGNTFVTRKITDWVSRFKTLYDNTAVANPSLAFDSLLDLRECKLELGNLNAKRDWTHVTDAVDAIYRICNQDLHCTPAYGHKWKSYCFGSGKSYTVRYFLQRTLELAFNKPFNDLFEFRGKGLDETLYCKLTDSTIVTVSDKFYRPAEVNWLECDPSLIKKELGWNPRYDLDDIITDMLFPVVSDKAITARVSKEKY